MNKQIRVLGIVTSCVALGIVGFGLAACGDTTVQVESVSLNETELTLEIGQTETLTATVLPEDAADKSVTWKSSAAGIATVEGGKVTAVAAGIADITVTTTDGGFSDVCKVTVTAAAEDPTVHVDSITLNPTSLTLEVGETGTFAATVLPENAANKSVTWKSSDDGIAKVNTDGTVTAVAAGSATITVTSVDGGKTADGTVTVTEPFFNGASAKISDTDFQNQSDFTIKKAADRTTDSVTVYAAAGTASKFSEQQKTAFGSSNLNAARDDFIVLKLANASSASKVEVGWLEKDNETISDSTIGYKDITEDIKTDGLLILCVTGPNRTERFGVKMDGKMYVLDIAELVTRDFFTVKNGSVSLDNSSGGTNSFANANAANLTITKDCDLYKITGKATAFTNENATAFDSSLADQYNSYIVVTLGIDKTETYYGGWIKTPDEELKDSNGNPGYKEHKGSRTDTDLVLLVTRKDAMDYKYFAIKVGNRQFVLDISGLDTGSNIFSGEKQEVDASGQTTTGGFKNKAELEFVPDGNIVRVEGKSTKFTETNKTKFSPDVTESDEYIVIRLGFEDSAFSDVSSYKCDWVNDPNKALDLGTEHNITVADGNKKDYTLTLCVTRAGRVGWYFRFEIDSGKRAYVLDLSNLKKEDGTDYVYNFFTKSSDEATLGGSVKFSNADGLTVTKDPNYRNVWKAEGKAQKFTSEQISAFNGSGVTADKDGYIVLTLDVKTGATLEMGWVKSVGETAGNSDTNSGYRKIESGISEDEKLVLRTTRDNRPGKIFWMRVDGVDYYLDCSNLTV